jgi:hypothetical protein
LPKLFNDLTALYNEDKSQDTLHLIYYSASKIRASEQNSLYLEKVLALTQKHVENKPGDLLASVLEGTIYFELAGVQREQNNWADALNLYHTTLDTYISVMEKFPGVDITRPSTQAEQIINRDIARLNLCLQDIFNRNPEQINEIKQNPDFTYLAEALGFTAE